MTLSMIKYRVSLYEVSHFFDILSVIKLSVVMLNVVAPLSVVRKFFNKNKLECFIPSQAFSVS